MYRYALTLFSSAFLLFLIQPMVAKIILPWFGGTANVWTTCMMYFQVTLLLGYLYAHFVRRFLSPSTVWKLHSFLLFMAASLVIVFQSTPPEWLKPEGGENLTWAIANVLSVSVGFPFLMLSTTGPLVQSWHSLSHGGDTYRLYAVSNVGSMLALLGYPFLIEPSLRVADQTFFWMVSFTGFVVLCIAGGYQTCRYRTWETRQKTAPESSEKLGPEKIGPSTLGRWIGLSMAPSIMLMATSNLMSQEVASIPFLWILPLAIYLMSLIICFDRPAWYFRPIYTPLLVLSIVTSVMVLHLSNQVTLLVQVLSFGFVCFTCSMSCHGELERLKPPAQHLTLFYLMMSLGGAFGGIFVVVIAPHLFNDLCEFHTGAALALILVIGQKIHEAYRDPEGNVMGAWTGTVGGLIGGAVLLSSLFLFADLGTKEGVLSHQRNEYGIVSIREKDGYRVMVNGRTEHGGQFVEGPKKLQPSLYYVQGSGPSLAFQSLRNDPSRKGKGLRIGVLGLGTGSIITWGKPNDEFVFYEINPLADQLARQYFTYLSDSPCKNEVILGDGRIQMERQLRETGSLELDILFLDAFTSDSIPAHLVTTESFELYWKHLKPDGILVAHITNRFVDMRPVIYGLAKQSNRTPVLINFTPPELYNTRWVLMTNNSRVLRSPQIRDAESRWPSNMEPVIWSDDFASLASVVDWSMGLRWNEPLQSKSLPSETQE